MVEEEAAFGVFAFIFFAGLVAYGIMRANLVTEKVAGLIMGVLKTRMAIASICLVMGSLLLYGIASYGLVNSLPGEAHVERHRDNNRVMIAEDKDGCMDTRSLGRSNGVYLSVKKCDPGIMKDTQAKANK